ncbi:hypothetical protein [Amycolatopsis alkalitolerans]|uniref:Uncharacterized protein n=1 Tax=Amycolatopsis alkalitolerans TaxID=2547244 RepID=A0A5C4LTR4_9PSEU|nr:hypothetical protein [Amycolatopsis alkalitolerans]TNC20980.1 hypothetical protein FG385_29470 [Amycolatopsis alkalitolerans]
MSLVAGGAADPREVTATGMYEALRDHGIPVGHPRGVPRACCPFTTVACRVPAARGRLLSRRASSAFGPANRQAATEPGIPQAIIAPNVEFAHRT